MLHNKNVMKDFDSSKLLMTISANTPSNTFRWNDGILNRTGILTAVENFTRPKGPGTCDYNKWERVINVLTSIPFVVVGINTIRKRKTTSGKLYGGSIVSVGAAAALFHCSDGRWRSFARKLDYWSCAVSASCLNKALFPNMPPIIFGACLGLTPFYPFCVSSVNTLSMECEYRKRALEDYSLKGALNRHNISSAVGLGLFYLDEKRPYTPLTHAAWHIASTMAVATTNDLLEHIERYFIAPGNTGQSNSQ